MAEMAKQRSIRDGRAPITSVEEVLRATYGFGDLEKFADVTRGRFQLWFAEGVVTAGMQRGVRAFNFEALATAAIAHQIATTFPRLPPLEPIMDKLQKKLAKVDWKKVASARGGKIFKIEVVGRDTADVGEGEAEVSAQDIGSPVGMEISVNVGKIAARLIDRILTAERSSTA